jgi:hypothetical protein
LQARLVCQRSVKVKSLLVYSTPFFSPVTLPKTPSNKAFRNDRPFRRFRLVIDDSNLKNYERLIMLALG